MKMPRTGTRRAARLSREQLRGMGGNNETMRRVHDVCCIARQSPLIVGSYV